MTKRATLIGYIILIVIYVFGTFCCFDLVREFNLTSKVLGYFQHSTSVSKINDFEYDITTLLFTNSGANENEYFAEVVTSPIEGFDKNKSYTLTINNIKANKIYGDFSYINVEFMNKFNSTQDTVLLTDILNIKVNFYTDGTKIVFITKNGEQAVKLWSSYIQKNGFKIKIIEDNFHSTIEADNIPNYTINLYAEDELVQTLTFNFTNYKEIVLPLTIKNKTVLSWKDSDGNSYETVPYKSIDLYAILSDVTNTVFTLNSNYSIVDDIPPGQTEVGSFGGNDVKWNMTHIYNVYGSPNTNNEKQQEFFNKINVNEDQSNIDFEILRLSLKINNFNFSINRPNVNLDMKKINGNWANDIYMGEAFYAYYIDDETKTIKIIDFSVNIIQNQTGHCIYLIMHERYRDYDNEIYKPINPTYMTMLNKDAFDNLSTDLAKIYKQQLQQNIEISVEVKNA